MKNLLLTKNTIILKNKKDYKILEYTINYPITKSIKEEVFANLIKRIEKKQIKPLVSKIYPLKNIVESQKEFLRKNHLGKIVLEI